MHNAPLLSKEQILEWDNYFDAYGTGAFDAAPLVETARKSWKLFDALDHLVNLASTSKQPKHVKESIRKSIEVLRECRGELI